MQEKKIIILYVGELDEMKVQRSGEKKITIQKLGERRSWIHGVGGEDGGRGGDYGGDRGHDGDRDWAWEIRDENFLHLILLLHFHLLPYLPMLPILHFGLFYPNLLICYFLLSSLHIG